MELYAGHGGSDPTAVDVASAMVQWSQKKSEHHAQELTVITMMYLVQAETYRIDLATVRWVAAELRPAPKKMTSCGGADRLEARRAGQE